MKYYPLIFLLIFGIYFSCNQVNTNSKDDTSFVEDFGKSEEIDSLMKKIDKLLIHDSIQQIAISRFSENDNLSYLPAGGNLGRLDLKISPEDKEQWMTFYLDGEDVILFRFREWVRTEKPRAREAHTYFENEKIVYCEERMKSLAQGEPPVSLKLEKFAKSSRGQKEVFLEFNKYWEPTLKAWQEHKLNN